MHFLRSSSPLGRWAVALGLLLVVGPLVQAATPCRGAAAPGGAASDAIVAAVAAGAQWSCSATDAGGMVRAVSSERSTSSLNGPSGGGAVGPVSAESLTAFPRTGQFPSPPPVSPTLDALRPVVLQI